jgi:hypothetical protein
MKITGHCCNCTNNFIYLVFAMNYIHKPIHIDEFVFNWNR